MGEVSASGEKDPYMQAYITARMKNQVEEMKLQKTLSSMEVSQRVRKIMINLELYEDRKMAHKLKQEVMNLANRQRQAMNRYVRSRGTRSLGTLTLDFSTVHGPGSFTAGDLSHPQPNPDTADKSRSKSEPTGVCFPPVPLPRRTRSQRTTASRTGGSQPELKRATSAGMWPGDPSAIRSVRRERRNVEEMLATLKAGEETRRLIRETTRSCSRNCNKPNILTLMERTYVNLPDLMPEKARQRVAEQEAAERDQPPLDLNRSSSGKLRRTNGRFDIDEEEAELRGNLPIYHIQYTALRDMGGTRRNSVFS